MPPQTLLETPHCLRRGRAPRSLGSPSELAETARVHAVCSDPPSVRPHTAQAWARQDVASDPLVQTVPPPALCPPVPSCHCQRTGDRPRGPLRLRLRAVFPSVGSVPPLSPCLRDPRVLTTERVALVRVCVVVPPGLEVLQCLGVLAVPGGSDLFSFFLGAWSCVCAPSSEWPCM